MKHTKLKINKPLALTIAASVGVVATAVVASYSTKHAIDRVKKAEEEKQEPLTVKEIIKTAIPSYIPTAAVTASTIVCICGIHGTHKKYEASLIAASGVLADRFKNYRKEVVEQYGQEKDLEICEKVLKSEWLDTSIYDSWPEGIANFYDADGDRIFQARSADVLQAEYELNRLFILQGFTTLYDWYQCLGIPSYDDDECMHIGWGDYVGPRDYGYSFIDFHHKKEKIRGVECISIKFPFPPTDDFLE